MEKNILKSMMMSVLTGVLLVYFALCCCLTPIAQAMPQSNAEHPSCHQVQPEVQHEADADHSSGDCECEHTYAVLNNTFALDSKISFSAYPIVESITYVSHPQVYERLAYQAPPEFRDTLPLYIRYSVYRI